MTLFWVLCAAILVIAILFVAVPLWRGSSKNNSVERNAANLEILRDQIHEMDNDLKNGLLTPELHEQGKRELESRLLEEVGEGSAQGAPAHPLKIAAIVLAVLLPLASAGLYLKLGRPDVMSPQAQMETFSLVHDEAGLQALEQKLVQNPNDPNTLYVLARSYVELGRYVDGAKKYDSLVKLVPNEAGLWAEYADALAMTHNSLVGAPTQLLERALQLDPNLPKALALSGTAAMERGDYAAAILHWQKLLGLLPSGSQDATTIQEALRQARVMQDRSKGGKIAQLNQANDAPQQSAPGKEAVSGTVTLSAALKGQAAPNDILYVFVIAAQGPKMPLAAIRTQVSDLPLHFTLDDSNAVAPQLKMSNFDRVVVVARISKSGNAMPKAGDLTGMSKPLALGTKGIKLVIDQTAR